MTGPETIWAWEFHSGYQNECMIGGWFTSHQSHNDIEYRRADLPATDAQALANDKVRALVDALTETAAILQAAVVSGKVRGGDSFRIGGVYLQTVSAALDASDAALAALEKDRTE